jgi:hypothetical protein
MTEPLMLDLVIYQNHATLTMMQKPDVQYFQWLLLLVHRHHYAVRHLQFQNPQTVGPFRRRESNDEMMYKRNDDNESHDEGDDDDMHIDEDEMGHENKKPIDKHYEMDQPSQKELAFLVYCLLR